MGIFAITVNFKQIGLENEEQGSEFFHTAQARKQWDLGL